MAQQQVHPGERQVERPESEANDECAERSVNEMQLILDNQIRRTERRTFLFADAWQSTLFVMSGGAIQILRTIPVSFTKSVNTSKQHLYGTLVGHLRELIHGRNNKGWETTVNLFIHDDDWEPLSLSCPPRKWTGIAYRIATISESSPFIATQRLHN